MKWEDFGFQRGENKNSFQLGSAEMKGEEWQEEI